MDAVNESPVLTTGGSPGRVSRSSGSRRRHLWGRKSKSEPDCKHDVIRRAAGNLMNQLTGSGSSSNSGGAAASSAASVRDNFGYSQDSTSVAHNTGTGSPAMSLRMRNAAVQCILLVDNPCSTQRQTNTGSVTSSTYSPPASVSSFSSERFIGGAYGPEPSMMTSSTARGTTENEALSSTTVAPYRSDAQFQRRKAIALANGDDSTLLTQHSAGCAGKLGNRTPTTDRSCHGGTRAGSAADDEPTSGGSCWDRLSPNDLGMRSDTLVSPRVSPLMSHRRVPSLVVTSSLDKTGQSCLTVGGNERQWLSVPSSCSRRRSSFGLYGNSDDSDTEPPQSPPVARRGRRRAIFDSKSLVLENGQEDGSSPINSCDESDTSSLLAPKAPSNRRKQSTVGLGTHYPGDLHSHSAAVRSLRARRAAAPFLKRNTIAEFANTRAYQESTASLISASAAEQDRKTKTTAFSILRLIERKGHRAKENLPELTEVLQLMKPSEFKDSHLAAYKNADWQDLRTRNIPATGSDVQSSITSSSITRHSRVRETERKRREAVWELFQSECIFLIDHLMALKHCFLEPLKKVQVEGFLMFAEPHELFGNLDELCYVSYTFCCDFASLLLKSANTPNGFGPTEVVVQGLKQFSQLTRDGEVYHEYCLNYAKAMTYLEQLRKNEDFVEFEKFCEQDPRCHRLQLTDLLISPMQHCTKVPLLLNNIRRYTEDPTEQQMLKEALEKLEKSINDLEAKMLWLKNFERVQEIQQQIQWQPITELEPRAFIPEFLRSSLSRQPCERILASPRRQLLYEGPVTLLEISKTVDMYMFLFDDILLLTRIKKPPRKKSSIGDASSQYLPEKVHTDGAVFVVHRQPIALDRFTVHDIRPSGGSGDWWQFFGCASGHLSPSAASSLLVAGVGGPTSGGLSGGGSLGPSLSVGGTAGSFSSCSAAASRTGSHHHYGSGGGAALSGGGGSISNVGFAGNPGGGSIDVTAGAGSNVFLRCLPAAAAVATGGGGGVKNSFVIVQITRFQQVIGVFTLQTQTAALKVTWLSRLQEAQAKYKDAVKQSDLASRSNDSNVGGGGSSGGGRPATIRGGDVIPGCSKPENDVPSYHRQPPTAAAGCGVSDVQTARNEDVETKDTIPNATARGSNGSVISRPDRLTSQRVLDLTMSLNSTFWSSTSSDRRSTTSSIQSIGGLTSRGSVVSTCPSLPPHTASSSSSMLLGQKPAVSRTRSVGPGWRARRAATTIIEEDKLFPVTRPTISTSGLPEVAHRLSPVVASEIGDEERERRDWNRSPSPNDLCKRTCRLSRSCPCIAIQSTSLSTYSRPRHTTVSGNATELVAESTIDTTAHAQQRSEKTVSGLMKSREQHSKAEPGAVYRFRRDRFQKNRHDKGSEEQLEEQQQPAA